MSLPSFLRNQRPNPAARWRIEHRHAEGGPWTEVGRASTLAAVGDELLAGSGAWSLMATPGDLVRVTGSRGVGRLYGLADDGVLRPLPPPRWLFDDEATAWCVGRTWAEAWETCDDARWMMGAAVQRVPRQFSTLAAVACARTTLPALPAEETRPAAALDQVEAWVRGGPDRGTLSEVSTRAWAVWRAMRGGSGNPDAVYAALTVAETVRLAEETWAPAFVGSAGTVPQNAALSAAGGFGDSPAFGEALGRLADVVREVIPLRVLVCVLAAPPRRSGTIQP